MCRLLATSENNRGSVEIPWTNYFSLRCPQRKLTSLSIELGPSLAKFGTSSANIGGRFGRAWLDLGRCMAGIWAQLRPNSAQARTILRGFGRIWGDGSIGPGFDQV